MTQTKSPWQSKTIWGGVVVLLIGVLKLFGFDISDELAGELAGLVESAVLVIAAGVVLWGRIAATRRIGPRPGHNGHALYGLALCCLMPACALLGGCEAIARLNDPAVLDADRHRLEAVEPVILEHAARHPEQAQTWHDFLAAWRASVDARGGE